MFCISQLFDQWSLIFVGKIDQFQETMNDLHTNAYDILYLYVNCI